MSTDIRTHKGDEKENTVLNYNSPTAISEWTRASQARDRQID